MEAALVTDSSALLHLTYRTGGGDEETLATTPNHPFYDVGRAAFVAAEELALGDELCLADGRRATVSAVRREEASDGRPFRTYNLSVDDGRTYFAGRLGAWVHNQSDQFNAICRLVTVEVRDRLKTVDVAQTSDEAVVEMILEGLRKRNVGDDLQLHGSHVVDSLSKGKNPTVSDARRSSLLESLYERLQGSVKPKLVQAKAVDVRYPIPNTLYESNGYFYRVDGEGRLAEVTGDLRLGKAPRNGGQQRNVGHSSGVAGDEGGHMIGAQFDGPGEGPLHMVPQSMNLNRGPGSRWRGMEERWKTALENGDKVSVKIEIDWPAGSKRPDGFRVKYEITDSVTGAKTPVSQFFENE
ncbi:MAG: DNA/RNA non-specific endonuclease [Planctomycetia bacterium]